MLGKCFGVAQCRRFILYLKLLPGCSLWESQTSVRLFNPLNHAHNEVQVAIPFNTKIGPKCTIAAVLGR